jgi:pyruvate formate lyase activating enzyme
MDGRIGASLRHPARYWHVPDDGRVQCDLCPRDGKLHEQRRGACFVRGGGDGWMVLSTYGHSSGFSIDPIEKMPLNHFFPVSSVFSSGTAGCSLACKSCQNWDVSRFRDMDRLMDSASPDAIATAARVRDSQSVASTCNDPVVFLESKLDTADACHQQGLMTVAVTAGYLHVAPRREFFARMDAANNCPACRHAAIVRDWYDIHQYDLTPAGCCPNCGASISGRLGTFGRPCGRDRIPVCRGLAA